MEKINKDQENKIMKDIEFLWTCTTEMNAYFTILRQLQKNTYIFQEQMNLSKAFYHYTYNALIVATFTEVSKIYDRNSKTNYFTFIEYCQRYIDLLLQIRKEKNDNIEEDKKVDREYLKDIFTKLKSDITELEPVFKNLKTQRDKIYAHNDSRSRDGVETIIEDNPISLKDMEELISCVTISLQFIYALITLIKRNPLPNNIGDLETTLIKLQENRKTKE
ncbi:transposase [Enterococcus faecalis]|uniref:AbiU2 domain-containing protein n=1 Tax=Enterococcus faecalis TaxID=1351 RepID=UPI001A967F0E|nr:transposase [Enterococcus faecalis]MBO1135534.1 transposase [Enterococcus faecalis]